LSRIYHETLIIGAGVSGLTALYLNRDRDIAAIEANREVGAKLRVSGGGKCNFTNRYVSYDNYVGDREFIEDVLEATSVDEILELFRSGGVEFGLKGGDKYFCKKSSKEIVEFFLKRIPRRRIYRNFKVESVTFREGFFELDTENGGFKCKELIVASGGVSYEKVGVSDIAYKVAEEFSHEVSPLTPALVGMTLQKEHFFFKELSGISLKVRLKVGSKEFLDDLLFTHRGVSGPVILNASLYWERGEMEVDFLPFVDVEVLKTLSRSKIKLPRRFLKSFLKRYEVEDLKRFRFAPAGKLGFKRAEVTKGGVDTSKINSKTLESTLQKGLYFLGEALDVTGELGGYNIHFAFATAKRLRLRR
jgi:predicted Rossmann fold flavoprotein